MAAVVWTGHLAFGMVSIPVSLYAAARAETIRFTRLQRKRRIATQGLSISATEPKIRLESGGNFQMSRSTSSQINGPLFSNGGRQSINLDIHSESNSAPRGESVEYHRVSQVLQSDAGGEQVAPHELVKGYEYGPGQYVAVEPAEYQKAAVETSDIIELFHYVKSDEVDPVYFERSYYVVPEIGGERAYALLLQAMRNQGCWGVARIGMHKREHILILRTTVKAIIAHTMFYANEVRKAPEFQTDPGLVREQELTVAEALIKGYFGSFEPQKFHDIYQQRLQDLIQTSLKSTPEPAISASRPNATIVPDLMEELKRSLFQIQHKPAKPVDHKTTRGKSRGRNKVSYAQVS